MYINLREAFIQISSNGQTRRVYEERSARLEVIQRSSRSASEPTPLIGLVIVNNDGIKTGQANVELNKTEALQLAKFILEQYGS